MLTSTFWSVSPGVGVADVGSAFSVASASGIQRKLFFSMHPLSVSNIGIAFSTDLEMKWLNVVSLPFRPWASLRCGAMLLL